MAKINLGTLHSTSPTARGYLWDVSFDGLHFIDDEPLSLRCTTAAQPQPEIPLITTTIRGWDIQEAGRVTWSELAFTCVETIDYSIYQVFYDYLVSTSGANREGAQDNDTASPELGDSQITIFLTDLGRGPVKTWTLEGCVITGALAYAELSPDHDGVQEFSFNVNYQHAEFG